MGSLVKLEIPEFLSSKWPFPSSDISEAFCLKLFQEVQKALKPNMATRAVKIKVCMPLNVFIDFFALSDRPIEMKNTMLVCRNVDPNLPLEFLDKGWDSRCVNGIVRIVNPESVNVKYMIKTQTFILSFFYKRSHNMNGVQVDLDQDLLDMENNRLIEIDIWMDNELQTTNNWRVVLYASTTRRPGC